MCCLLNLPLNVFTEIWGRINLILKYKRPGKLDSIRFNVLVWLGFYLNKVDT